ncbi:RagB/SusD family nutrient uptake outer membrane protein [Chitinophaga oryziterrae]|uniref:RagB/SusD family nutrient uptake outer membrane protein n=1 Tax=Chitinophaga oryziterrae TaxID=1031224 RepID=A0A6N8JD44_9BACT|nr:RagB/SusD family nutrient uptake outer membrane protein [Chitinophaga oryziterrae]MVT42032.1 RagB/SusD family nutrient uptake outer membrane protein [Chitinophaga oryziterrae]
MKSSNFVKKISVKVYAIVKKVKFIGLTAILFFIHLQCKKLVEIPSPLTQPDSKIIYSSNSTAISVLTGIYTRLSGYGSGTGITSISMIAGLTADELKGYPTYYSMIPQAYANSLLSTNALYWTEMYNYIYATNAAIEGLESSSGISDQVKHQLLGEAKFMRAFFHFYLVNLFGDIPIITSTNYKENIIMQRMPKAEVYKQIISDLKDAQNSLNENYVGINVTSSSDERVRPNKFAATALLARTYLYIGDWKNAEDQSSRVINNVTLYDTIPLASVFLKNSKEAIWQLQPINIGWNTEDARIFILLTGVNDEQPVSVSKFLYDAFEMGDLRKSNWLGNNISNGTSYYYPFKYKSAIQNAPVTEYLMVLRLAEQYLIRAEARANLGNVTGSNSAATDLNVIRTRAGLANTTAITASEMLASIMHERQVELFSEWGHRWFDLKRNGLIDAVMAEVTPQKGGVWNNNWSLYPIPLATIQASSTLHQNPGYQ